MTESPASQRVYRATVSRIPTPEERAAELERFERQAARDRLRDLARTCVECLLWCIVGLVLLGCAVRADDEGWSRIALYSGLVVGNAGIFTSLYCAHLRAIERGDIV